MTNSERPHSDRPEPRFRGGGAFDVPWFKSSLG